MVLVRTVPPAGYLGVRPPPDARIAPAWRSVARAPACALAPPAGGTNRARSGLRDAGSGPPLAPAVSLMGQLRPGVHERDAERGIPEGTTGIRSRPTWSMCREGRA